MMDSCWKSYGSASLRDRIYKGKQRFWSGPWLRLGSTRNCRPKRMLGIGEEYLIFLFQVPSMTSFVLPHSQPPFVVCIRRECAHKVEVLLQESQAPEVIHRCVSQFEDQELMEGNSPRRPSFSAWLNGHEGHGTKTAPSFRNGKKTVHESKRLEWDSWCSCLKRWMAASHPFDCMKRWLGREDGLDPGHGLCHFVSFAQ